MRLTVRPTNYRGKDGYMLYGTDPRGRRVRIFATSRFAIENIRGKVRLEEAITADDFGEWEP